VGESEKKWPNRAAAEGGEALRKWLEQATVYACRGSHLVLKLGNELI